MPATSQRVRALVEAMTLEQKAAQIVGFWQDEAGDVVAPLQGEAAPTGSLEEAYQHGLGHLTRVYGTNPFEPAERAAWLWQTQRKIAAATEHGIPALVHEECLTGLAAWKAATFPTPLAWGAAGDEELVHRMGAAIGGSMRELGIHQGLSPVLDVIRDPRWGRVDECIAEDPYLVGSVGTAYVQGLQGAGVHATLKHFVGYSASKAGRNFAPVSMGPRELADVMLPPFEMAIKDGGVRSVMHAYNEIDGVPVAANRDLLTGVLRDQWGFDGVVVADYFGVAFLHILQEVAHDLADAAAQALEAGVDVELPTGDAFVGPLLEAVRSGAIDEALVDRAVLRALKQKEDLGLLDEDFSSEPPADIDLDSPEHRAIARELAEKSIVLVSNDGTLPLEPAAVAGKRVAVIGPNADRYPALFGCYSFANHVLAQRDGYALGIEAPTVLESLRAELADADITFEHGCDVDSADTSGIAAASAAVADADVAVVVVGDHAGLFGRGTVGEGCDRDDLELPGVQRALIEAALDTGTPVVLVLLTGRPYAVRWAIERSAAVIQSFFPGEEGGPALARVLSGATNPSGRLPVTLPRSAGSQPYSYLHPPLGGKGDVTNLDPAPAAEFGHGLAYTTFGYSDFSAPAEAAPGGPHAASVTVTNTGQRSGSHIVQLYARVRHASVTRPVAQLVGFARVSLAPGESAQVSFEVPATRLAYSVRDGRRVVEPRTVEWWCGTSSVREAEGATVLTGDEFVVTGDSPRLTAATVD